MSSAASGRRPADVDDVRVLVVEDTPAVAALIQQSLEADGLRVELVASLRDARTRLDADVADVVVLDIELPDGSGLDLLRDPPVSDVPVVIVSSHQDETDRVAGLQLGADDYVVKPFFPRELAARVRLAAGRGQTKRPAELDFGDLVINLDSRAVRSRGAAVRLPQLADAIRRFVFDRQVRERRLRNGR